MLWMHIPTSTCLLLTLQNTNYNESSSIVGFWNNIKATKQLNFDVQKAKLTKKYKTPQKSVKIILFVIGDW